MGRRRFSKVCDFLAEAGILFIFLLAVLFSWSISFRHSLVLFGFLCFFVLEALRPPVRILSWSLLLIFVAGAAGFTTRFFLSYPLSASPTMIRRNFIGSLLHPLPAIWAVLLVAGVLYILYRGYAAALGSSSSPPEVVLLLFIALAIYQISLSWRWSVNISGKTVSLPYSVGLLFCALVFRCTASLFGPPRTAFAAPPLMRSQLAAAGFIAGHLLVLALFLIPNYDLEASHVHATGGSLLGLMLFAGLVNAQLGSAPSRRRFRLLLTLILAAVVVSSWSRVEMLPEIGPSLFIHE